MQPTDPSSKLKYYWKLSLGIHLGLFFLLWVGQWISPYKPLLFQPSVQIDMVALPDLVKSQDNEPIDKSLPVKDAPPPRTPPKEEAEEEEDVKVMAKPEKEPSFKKEKQAEKEAKKALERLRAMQKKEQKEEQKKRQELVNKREEDLKRFEDTYRSAVRGNQTNQGTSLSGAMAEAQNAYLGHITDRLRSNWALPVWLQSKGLRAVVWLAIDARGNIVQSRFQQPSGNEMFDNAVRGTLQRSTPFQPPPDEMARTLRNTGMEVQFPL